MFASPGTPRRPQTATERLNSVRTSLHALKDSVDVAETFSLSHLAAGSHPPTSRQQTRPSHDSAKGTVRKAPTPPPTHSPRYDPAHRSLNEVAAKSGGNGWTASHSLPESQKFGVQMRNHATGSPTNHGTDAAAMVPYSSALQQRPPTAAGLQSFEDDILTMKQHTIKIEEHLAVEGITRQEADRKLKGLVDQRVKDLLHTLEKKATDRIAELHVQLSGLTKKVETLQGELASEREKNTRLTQELKYHATHGFADVRDNVAQVRHMCQSSQALLAKTLTENLFRLQERLDVERHARESMLRGVTEEIAQTAKQREKFDDRVLQKIRDDVSAVESMLRIEKDTREKTEEQLAVALEDVVTQVQLGLRNVVR